MLTGSGSIFVRHSLLFKRLFRFGCIFANLNICNNFFKEEQYPSDIRNVQNFSHLSKEMANLMESKSFVQEVVSLMYQDITDDTWANIPQVLNIYLCCKNLWLCFEVTKIYSCLTLIEKTL